MSEDPAPARRRRRRASAPATDPSPTAGPAPEPVAAPAAEERKPRRRPPRDGSGDRGLRDLVGAGPSQLGVSAALRGRDANRPTDEDLAEAERDVVIVRRHWHPDDRR